MSLFGAEFDQIWPKAGQAIKLTTFGKNLLKKCQNIEKPDGSKIDIEEFMKTSSKFPIEFGINTCRVMSQPKERHEIIKQQIASAYPVIHERVLGLYLDFLEHKCKYGNARELNIYPNMTLTAFVQRLLQKRCVSFFGEWDEFLLMSGETGQGGYIKVGSSAENAPLTMENVLSYDEIKLSAFLSVSSHSEFINDGNRQNAGQIETDKNSIVSEGVVIGIIGGRFERPDVMESQDILITKTQNTTANGYGDKNRNIAQADNREKDYRRIWREFYEEQDFLYSEVATVESPRFSKTTMDNAIFDNLVMKKRYAISFDTLLLESEAKAAAVGKQCYIHVVGIGLGVWKAVKHQTSIFLSTFTERLRYLLPQLAHVGAVHFSYFHVNECGELKNGGFLANEAHPNGGIRTYLSNRNPAEKLAPEHENMLLIVSYAWDGNALPGNEFWMKMLTSTGDSSTACSTLIAELHNPHINIDMVNGNNLHVATLQHGIKHISVYSKEIMGGM